MKHRLLRPFRSLSVHHRMMGFLVSGAFLGKILGFGRELLMARVFGASLPADAFRAAGTAVNAPLVPMQGEGVTAVMVPLHREWQGEGTAPEKLAALSAGLTAIAIAIMLAIELFAQWWTHLFVGGMEPKGQSLVQVFLHLMAFWMPASVLLNCLCAGEIAMGRSRIAALRPTFLNISIMAGIGLYLATDNLLCLPISFAVSFNVLAAWAIVSLAREGLLSRKGLSLRLILSVARVYFRRLRPLMGQPFTEQGQVWIERLIASSFAVGTIASIDYARTLTDCAVLLISQPLGLVILSRGLSDKSQQAASALASALLALFVPASVCLFFFAHEVVDVVFARGAFDARAVDMTAAALQGISVGLWAATLGWVLLRLLNNAGRNGRAAAILTAAYSANALVNILAMNVPESVASPSFLIGLGEALRGLILLFGTALALGFMGKLLTLIAYCLVPAAALGYACHLIKQTWTSDWTHLFVGAALCLSISGITFLIMAAFRRPLAPAEQP